MDSLDLAILENVQRDARIRQADIAHAEGVSVSTINDRLRRLQDKGMIAETVARLAAEEVGFGVCAFVQVLIGAPEQEQEFLSTIGRLEEVQECHCVTGEFSYLLKVRAVKPASLEQFLRDRVKSIPGVLRTNTMIALSTAKETTALPLHLIPPDD